MTCARGAVWVQRFQVMLGPLLRRRRLRLWADVDIRAGQRWGAEIDAAVRCSTAALVLVSPALLDSDFVPDVELPALQRHGVRLAPMLDGVDTGIAVLDL